MPSTTHRIPGPLRLALVLTLACGLLLTGCRGESAEDDLPYRVDISTAPTPPIVGPVRMVVTVTDEGGTGVEGAEVRVEGTMTHAGMVPILETAEAGEDGRYVVPAFDFTMGGDWILITRVRLPDGQELRRERTLRVVGDPP